MNSLPKTYVFFSAQFLPHMGGVENYTVNLSKELLRQGSRVIVATSANGMSPSCEVVDGIEVYRLPSFSLLKGRLPITKKNKQYGQMMAELDSIDVDYVIVNTRFYPHSVEGLRYARRKGITPLLIDHGSAYLTLNNAVIDKLIALHEHAITKVDMRYSPDVYAVSKRGAKWVSTFGISAKGVLNNAIDAQSFRDMSSGRDFVHEYMLDPEGIVVSFTGRLIPEKGIDILLDAAALVNSSSEVECPIYFFLAGEGPLLQKIEESGLVNVFALGRLTLPDVSALLSQSDVFCLPSRSEGFATSLLECAAWGVAPVITRVGGVDELIPSSEYGCVLDNATPECIANAIIDLADNPEEMRRKGASIQKHVECNFSWSKTAEDLHVACVTAQCSR